MAGASHIPLWRRQPVRALLLLPIGFGFLYLAFRKVEMGALLRSFGAASYLPVVGAMLVGLMGHLLRALRWRIQLLTLSPAVSVSEVLYAVMLGYTVNLIVPRAGEVARCGQVASAFALPIDRAIGTMIGERMADMLVSLLLLAVAVGVSYNHFGQFVFGALAAQWGAFTPGQLALGGGGLLALAAVAYVLYRVGRRRIGPALAGLLAGVRTLWRTPQRALFLLYTLLLWGAYWLMTYLVCLALPTTAQLPLLSSLLLLVVGTLGMIVPVQGGIGSFHMAVALWLQLEGIPPSDALAYATLSHGAQMVLVLLLTMALLLARTLRLALCRRRAMQ